MLVFGGSCGAYCFLGDLWSLTVASGGPGPGSETVASWSRLLPPDLGPQPPARYDHAATWNQRESGMFLFGGVLAQVLSYSPWRYVPLIHFVLADS